MNDCWQRIAGVQFQKVLYELFRGGNMQKYIEYLKSLSGKALVTIAIGDQHRTQFEENVLPTWLKYAATHNLGVIAFIEDLIPRNSTHWKKPTWQKMLLPKALQNHFPELEFVCYLDTDILINPTASSIFLEHLPGKVSSVSLRHNLPFEREHIFRKLNLLRKEYTYPDYPLDSALHISLADLYSYHELKVQPDEVCAGVLLFNPKEVEAEFTKWFYMYDSSLESITNGGDQTHFNFHLQDSGILHTIDYKWQKIWSFEVAEKYPFLFYDNFEDVGLMHACIKASLSEAHFLHFAGSWPESRNWLKKKFSLDASDIEFNRRLDEYEQIRLTGMPLGTIKPE